MIEEIAKWMATLVKPFEGLHKVVGNLVFPYICPAGYPTQGFGILVKDLNVPPIGKAEAERRMFAILPGYIMDTLKACPRLWLCPPEVIAAISDFTYNLGAARLRSSTLRRKINAGEWPAAYRELEKWVNGGGRKLPGLVRRRQAEIQLIKRAFNEQ